MMINRIMFRIRRYLSLEVFSFILIHPIFFAQLVAQYVRRHGEANLAKALPNPIHVLDGPFRGMRYLDIGANCSAYYPKIFGCYESELNNKFEQFCETDYSYIIDVGCAEGYYAVGLSLRIPGARVLAYDTNIKAVESCARLALVNGREKAVVVKNECSPSELGRVVSNRKALVICDCEGV